MLFKSVAFALAISMVHGSPFALQQQHQEEQFMPYSYGYSTVDGISHQEHGNNGVVQGSYSYTDPNGDLRQVKYVADAHGFRPEGDIGVDRRTAEAAAALAALAPKGPAPGVARAAPIIASGQHWAPPAQQSFAAVPAVAPFQSFNSFEKLLAAPVAPASPSWSSPGFQQQQQQHHIAPSPIAAGHGAVGYHIETPTHKVWVKY